MGTHVDRTGFDEVGPLDGRGAPGTGYALRTGTGSFEYAFAWPEGDDEVWSTLCGNIDLDAQPDDYLRGLLEDGGFRYETGNPRYDPLSDFKATCGEDRWQVQLLKVVLRAQLDERYLVPDHYRGAQGARDALRTYMGTFGSPSRDPLTTGAGGLDRDHAESARGWYLAAYPDDTLGADIPERVTMGDLIDSVARHTDFYEALGVGDSLIRERFFEEIANRLSVSYGDVYDSSFKNIDLPKDVMSALDGTLLDEVIASLDSALPDDLSTVLYANEPLFEQRLGVSAGSDRERGAEPQERNERWGMTMGHGTATSTMRGGDR